MMEDTFQGVGGVRIFTRAWRPAGPVRGVVVIAPGFNAHSGQYDWVANELAAHGLAVHALDFRGRGQSGGERFYVARFADYVSDLATCIGRAKAGEPGRPVFLLGHSAGGVVACAYAAENPGALAGLICESFAYQVPAPGLVLAALKGIAHIAPHLGVLKLKNDIFSREPKVVAAMNADPLIAGEKQPAQTVAELVRAANRLTQSFASMTLPLLILHGTADKATRPSGSQAFYDAAGATDKTLKLYDGHYHDLLHDIGKEAVLADIIRWIDTHLPKG